jgi:RNase P subunit RPR2
MEKEDVKRPICPNCQKEMIIVKVNSCSHTVIYWDCECTSKFYFEDIFDREDNV